MSESSLLEKLDAHILECDYKYPFPRTKENLIEQARVRRVIEDEYDVFPLTEIIWDNITAQEIARNSPDPANTGQDRMSKGYSRLLERAAGLVVAGKITVEEIGPKIKDILAGKALEEGLITEQECRKLGIKLGESREPAARQGGYRQVVAGK